MTANFFQRAYGKIPQQRRYWVNRLMPQWMSGLIADQPYAWEASLEAQEAKERNAVMGEERNEAPSRYLMSMVPYYHNNTILDLGCGTGYWSKEMLKMSSLVKVWGMDSNRDYLNLARHRYETDRLKFFEGDLLKLPFMDESVDVVYADNVLEHSVDIDKTLREVERVLKNRGCLVAAIPLDANNPKRVCPNHYWKASHLDVVLSSRLCGLDKVSVEKINTRRKFGANPYAPSNDMVAYVTAWKYDEAKNSNHNIHC